MIAEFPKNNSRRSFSPTINYAAREMDKYADLPPEEKPEMVYYQNIDNPYFAAEEMELTATKGKLKDPVTHLIISMDEGENPTTEQLQEICKHTLETTGYGNRQAIAYLQKDNGICHLHIVANKVDPATYRGLPDKYTRNKANYALAEKAMREMEIKQGWRRVDGKHYSIYKDQVVRTQDVRKLKARDFEFQKSKADKAIAYEYKTGLESFQARCLGAPKKDVEELFRNQQKVSWQELHACLDKHHLEIRQHTNAKGQNGYVIVDKSDPDKYHMRASDFSNKLFRKSVLDAKIGTPYEAPALMLRGNKAQSYQVYIQKQRGNNPLYDQYLQGKHQYRKEMAHIKAEFNRNFRDQAKAINRRACVEINQVERMMQRTRTREVSYYRNNYERFFDCPSIHRGYGQIRTDKARINVLGTILTLSPKFYGEELSRQQGAARIAEIKLRQQQEITALKAGYICDKDAIMKKYASYRSDYKTFLTKEADWGNAQVMAELARMNKSHPMVANNSFEHTRHDSTEQTRDIRDLEQKVHLGGNITYSWKDTGKEAFIDTKDAIKVIEHSDESIKAAIQMAQERGKLHIKEDSSAAFRDRAAEIATDMGIKVLNLELQHIVAKAEERKAMERQQMIDRQRTKQRDHEIER